MNGGTEVLIERELDFVPLPSVGKEEKVGSKTRQTPLPIVPATKQ